MSRQQGGWQAQLELGFALVGERTVLRHRWHRGPLVVQRPFYPEGDAVCHVIVLHPPGGVVGGDQLHLDVTVADGAKALLTTPAANKFYRGHATASVIQRLSVASGAVLEWLPQETICFSGAQADTTTRVQLGQDGTFIGWEMICFGRPASQQAFEAGQARLRFELWRDDRPLLLERGRFVAGDAIFDAQWGLQGRTLMGTMVCTADLPDAVEVVRQAVVPAADALFSVSQLDGVLVCRYLGNQAGDARRCFQQAWHVLRPLAVGVEACPPRIWNT